jgi:arylsulfatase A-like enzyme
LHMSLSKHHTYKVKNGNRNYALFGRYQRSNACVYFPDELPPDFPKAIPAPWYQNTTIPEEKAPRIPNYNLSCPNHHWLVRNQPPLTTLQGNEVDKLYQSRLKSLLSVDDLVEEMIQTLDDLEILDNTYVIFTSDNGFRLGQFRIPGTNRGSFISIISNQFCFCTQLGFPPRVKASSL